MKKTISILILGTILCLASCKKTEGPEGPPGTNGTNGTNGVANIQTFTFTTNTNQWIADNPNNLFYYQYNCAAVTSEIMATGVVLVYLGDGTGSQWVAMPFSTKGIEFTYGIKSGIVEIDVSLSSGLMPSNPGGQQFKVVVIPK